MKSKIHEWFFSVTIGSQVVVKCCVYCNIIKSIFKTLEIIWERCILQNQVRLLFFRIFHKDLYWISDIRAVWRNVLCHATNFFFQILIVLINKFLSFQINLSISFVNIQTVKLIRKELVYINLINQLVCSNPSIPIQSCLYTVRTSFFILLQLRSYFSYIINVSFPKILI